MKYLKILQLISAVLMSTIISFELPVAGNVQLTIYDVTGREVQTLLNEYRQKGTYNIPFNGADLPGGYYLYKITCDSLIEMRKMLLIK